VMVKNQYPWFWIDDLFDQLSKVKVFSKIDLICSRYYQIRIAERDEKKIVCHTSYGSYEFLMMPFGFTNAPTTCCTFMNDIFWEWLNDFVVVYIDDILVYNNLWRNMWNIFERCSKGWKKTSYMLNSKNANSRWWKWIGSPKKTWRWMTTRWRQFWIGSHLGQFPLKVILKIGLLLLQVHKKHCQDSHVFDKPFEEVIQNLWMGWSM